MMRIILLLITFILSSTTAQAATQRIDVTGAFHTARVNGAIDQFTWDRVRIGPYDTSDASFLEFELAPFFLSNTGSALFDGEHYSNCTGLLFALCWGYADSTDETMFGSSDVGTTFQMTATMLRYADDLERTGIRDGIHFFAHGATVMGRVDSLEITDVPLPSAALLLLGGLGLLGTIRRRRA